MLQWQKDIVSWVNPIVPSILVIYIIIKHIVHLQIAMKLATGFAKGACLSRPAFAATEVDVMLAFVKAAFIDPARTLWNPKTWVFIVTMAEDAWQALDLDTQRVRPDLYHHKWRLTSSCLVGWENAGRVIALS